MPQRIMIEEERSTARRPIDAGWSSKRKGIVAACAVGAAAVALGAGTWFYITGRTPPLPRTAEEAVSVMASARFDRLDDARKVQYVEEARRLISGLSPEQRRELRMNEQSREAMRVMMEQTMDDIARRFARGEEIDFRAMWGGGDGQVRSRQDWQQRREGADGEERPWQRDAEAMRSRVEQRMAGQIESGNAQSMGLRMEMFKRFQGSGRGGLRGGMRRGGGG